MAYIFNLCLLLRSGLSFHRTWEVSTSRSAALFPLEFGQGFASCNVVYKVGGAADV